VTSVDAISLRAAAPVEREALEACELNGLFLEPDRMRGGIGRRLVDEAVRMARTRGAARVVVVANPQATAFYEAVGFTTGGESQTRTAHVTDDRALSHY
jgi:predicted N-acetyltransferase YhbS